MKDAKEKLSNLNSLENFSPESQEIWRNFLDYISEDDALMLVDIINKDSKITDYLIRNLLIKHKNQKNKKELKNLFKKEKEK